MVAVYVYNKWFGLFDKLYFLRDSIADVQASISVLPVEDYVNFVFHLFFEVDIFNRGRFVAYLADVFRLFEKFGFYVFSDEHKKEQLIFYITNKLALFFNSGDGVIKESD